MYPGSGGGYPVQDFDPHPQSPGQPVFGNNHNHFNGIPSPRSNPHHNQINNIPHNQYNPGVNQSHLQAVHHHSVPSPNIRSFNPYNNYASNSPYSFSAMQSPPSLGSPGQHFGNPGSQPMNTALSPTRSIGSPLGYPVGSPLMRQHSGSAQGPAHGGLGSSTVPSPSGVPASPSQHSVLSPGSHSASAGSNIQPERTQHSSPVRPVAMTNGPAASHTAKELSRSNPNHINAAEEPLPHYPSPEEIERFSAQARPMIPEAVLQRIFAKAGVSFLDPKIEALIALTSQNLIVDIVKEAMAVGGGQGKSQERVLTRQKLEKVLQERGLKQLPPDPFGNFR